MPENCKACGDSHPKTGMVDVVITVRGDAKSPYVQRWCLRCAKETEGKPWFGYLRDADKETKKRWKEMGGTVKQEGAVTVFEDAGTVFQNEKKAMTAAPRDPPKRPAKGVSGWQLMKAKYPTAAAASAAVDEAKRNGKSAGTIRVLEGLLKMRTKEESK